MNLTLSDRAAVVAAIWPAPADIGTRINRAAVVQDVELGLTTPSLSPAERERVVAEIVARDVLSREPGTGAELAAFPPSLAGLVKLAR